MPSLLAQESLPFGSLPPILLIGWIFLGYLIDMGELSPEFIDLLSSKLSVFSPECSVIW